MSEQDIKWYHAGISKVKDDNGSCVTRIPDRLFKEDEMLIPGNPVYWSFEKVVGILVASNNRLQDEEEYTTVDFRKFQGEENNYTCVIPKRFFDDYQGRGNPHGLQPVPEHARVKLGDRYHFMYSTRMAEGNTRSCYVLNDQQFSDRFENSDIWDGTLDQVPRFI